MLPLFQFFVGQGDITAEVQATSSLGLGSSASAVRNLPELASSPLYLGSVASAVKVANRSASAGLGLGSVAICGIQTVNVTVSTPFGLGSTATAAASRFLGRFQRGKKVTVSLTLSGMPDAVPVALVRIGSNDPVAYPLPVTGSRPIFARSIRLGPDFALGTYQVNYVASVDSQHVTIPADTFEVVPGGDSGGEVISMHAHDRPEARYVLAQLGSGRLVQGKNPSI